MDMKHSNVAVNAYEFDTIDINEGCLLNEA